MIFDFISGEAGTQEGGDKFAKWLAEDTDLTQKEKKSVIEKIKDFFTKRLDSTRNTRCVTSTLRRFWTRCGVWQSRCPMSKRQRQLTIMIGTAMTCFFCILHQKVLQ